MQKINTAVLHLLCMMVLLSYALFQMDIPFLLFPRKMEPLMIAFSISWALLLSAAFAALAASTEHRVNVRVAPVVRIFLFVFCFLGAHLGYFASLVIITRMISFENPMLDIIFLAVDFFIAIVLCVTAIAIFLEAYRYTEKKEKLVH